MKDFLNNEYNGKGTLTVGANLEYLNINLKFNKDDQSCYISQEHYWQKVINKFNVLEYKKCPHKRGFMEKLRKRLNAAMDED